MSTEPTTQVSRVHLADDDAAALDLPTPIETDRIDHYDAGIWVTSGAGRDFFPYEQVLTIRERSAPAPMVARAGGGTEPDAGDRDDAF